MRFIAFTSLALALTGAVSSLSIPSGAQELAVRKAALGNPEDRTNFYYRDTSDDVYTREAAAAAGGNAGLALDARAKYKPSKIDLDFPKKLERGSIAQKEREEATDLAKKALFQAEVTAGKVIYGWHDENTEDPVEHFTVRPTDGPGDGKGNIHVHRDGSWTQGAGGKANHGDGQV
ncbi:hypothetical protein J7T55_006128 [Diaporthe amygdali]|uniref:uncharacterized protein n=1 Tax=Phomopsis amygdali TaxID=1214568 RepID=UPI0022FE1ED4|nr:uncharacterized protein J7T55_006128 [Diaporthe amygdali]KAJ0124787.1 hypothetical protein J7T55_006128 [Diaporthe amygdali]